ncbi:ORF16 [Agrotis segetum granulovirus]|uniref:ORF16 n=1 Tax=Agrotis segetum granulosis virus TaxID=10464 RepID=Q9WHF4_GVAS|nr:hypothetical protein AsGV017 [Agrotis segetum granulovirus]AAD34383.1 unknown [Agrotis segetum granulovirus]AAS82722.1 ORF16 [Agrotis segetum granulovirus]AHN92056.1 hypothetical protein AsGV017 [Agrotis segetum granulovirus]AKN63291.1 hypothetical protein AsGV017 [Agrotis segetum granulovirus]
MSHTSSRDRKMNTPPAFFKRPLTEQLSTVNRMKHDIVKVSTRYEKLAKLDSKPYEIRKQLQEKRTEFLKDFVEKL